MFHQAIGKFRFQQHKTATMSLYRADLWHTILGLSAWKIVLIVAVLYTISFALFAWFYMLVDPVACALDDKRTFAEFYQFSMQTGVTIGYGVVDPSFRGCPSMAALITLQSIISMLLDAFCIGVVYDRISAAGNRGRTVVFSNKAVLDCIGGLWHLQFRAADIRSMQLSESHVRLVAVWHDIGEAGERVHYFQSENLRVHDPDDEIGGNLLLFLPQPVSHVLLPVAATRTDPRSPLLPSSGYLSAWREMEAAGVHEGKMTAWQWREMQLARAAAPRPQRLLPFGPMYSDDDDSDDSDSADAGGGEVVATGAGVKRVPASPMVQRRQSKGAYRRGAAGHFDASGPGTRLTPGVLESVVVPVGGGMPVAHSIGTASVNGEDSDEGKAGSAAMTSPSAAAVAAVLAAGGGSSSSRHRSEVRAPQGVGPGDYGVLSSSAATASKALHIEQPDSRVMSVSRRLGLAERMATEGASSMPLASATGTAQPASAEKEEATILRFWRESEMEVLCIIEGIDSVSSDTTQARHSYTAADIEFGHTFVPCTKRGASGECIVEFDLFHDTEPSTNTRSYMAPSV
jgi:hypothetical protein